MLITERIIDQLNFILFLQKEQEDIVKRRPSSDVGLNFDEIKQMTFLSQVIKTILCFFFHNIVIKELSIIFVCFCIFFILTGNY